MLRDAFHGYGNYWLKCIFQYTSLYFEIYSLFCITKSAILTKEAKRENHNLNLLKTKTN